MTLSLVFFIFILNSCLCYATDTIAVLKYSEFLKRNVPVHNEPEYGDVGFVLWKSNATFSFYLQNSGSFDCIDYAGSTTPCSGEYMPPGHYDVGIHGFPGSTFTFVCKDLEMCKIEYSFSLTGSAYRYNFVLLFVAIIVMLVM